MALKIASLVLAVAVLVQESQAGNDVKGSLSFGGAGISAEFSRPGNGQGVFGHTGYGHGSGGSGFSSDSGLAGQGGFGSNGGGQEGFGSSGSGLGNYGSQSSFGSQGAYGGSSGYGGIGSNHGGFGDSSRGYGGGNHGGFGSNGQGGFPSNSLHGFESNGQGSFGSNGQGGFGSNDHGGFGSTGQSGFGSNAQEGFGSNSQSGFRPYGQNSFGASGGNYVPSFSFGQKEQRNSASTWGGHGNFFNSRGHRPSSGYGSFNVPGSSGVYDSGFSNSHSIAGGGGSTGGSEGGLGLGLTGHGVGNGSPSQGVTDSEGGFNAGINSAFEQSSLKPNVGLSSHGGGENDAHVSEGSFSAGHDGSSGLDVVLEGQKKGNDLVASSKTTENAGNAINQGGEASASHGSGFLGGLFGNVGHSSTDKSQSGVEAGSHGNSISSVLGLGAGGNDDLDTNGSGTDGKVSANDVGFTNGHGQGGLGVNYANQVSGSSTAGGEASTSHGSGFLGGLFGHAGHEGYGATEKNVAGAEGGVDATHGSNSVLGLGLGGHGDLESNGSGADSKVIADDVGFANGHGQGGLGGSHKGYGSYGLGLSGHGNNLESSEKKVTGGEGSVGSNHGTNSVDGAFGITSSGKDVADSESILEASHKSNSVLGFGLGGHGDLDGNSSGFSGSSKKDVTDSTASGSQGGYGGLGLGGTGKVEGHSDGQSEGSLSGSGSNSGYNSVSVGVKGLGVKGGLQGGYKHGYF